MGALFIVVTLVLGGTLYLARPTLQEYVLPSDRPVALMFM
jgi:hypothetical protein